MKKRYVVVCGGFQSSFYYDRYEEAQERADFRTKCTGMEWEVREVIIP